MNEYIGKESYEGYFTKIKGSMAARFDAGISNLKTQGIDVAVPDEIFIWASVNVPDLYQEEKDLVTKISNIWHAGKNAASFDEDDFKKYQQVVRDWGSVTNKIFNRFFKFLEESHNKEVTVVEEEPAQVEMSV